MGRILHLVQADYYAALPSGVPYRPHGFDRDGFIHCTQGGETLLRVANAHYGQKAGEFIVLIIDESRVAAPVKYERPEPADDWPILFPHVYGPLNRDAIVDVARAQRANDGRFIGFDRALD